MHGLTILLMCVIISAIVPRRTEFLCDCGKLYEIIYYCPNYNDSDWKCRAGCHNCTEGKVYHCAKRYDSPKIPDYEVGTDLFTEGCAVEKKCVQGEEPVLTFIVNQKQVTDPVVYCEKCYNKNMYNPVKERMSSTYRQCDVQRKNECTEDEHKIECDDSRSSSDRSCRCDARRGYMPETGQNENGKKCSTEVWMCIFKKCLDGQMLLNYTCAPFCPQGTNRSEESDNCVPVQNRETLPNVSSEITQTTPKQRSEKHNTTRETKIYQTTTKQIVDNTGSSVSNDTILVASILGSVSVIIVILVLFGFMKFYKDKLSNCVRRSPPTVSGSAHEEHVLLPSALPNNAQTNKDIDAESQSLNDAPTDQGERVQRKPEIPENSNIEVETEQPLKQSPTVVRTNQEKSPSSSTYSTTKSKEESSRGVVNQTIVNKIYNEYFIEGDLISASGNKVNINLRNNPNKAENCDRVDNVNSLSKGDVSSLEKGSTERLGSPVETPQTGVGRSNSLQMNGEEDIFNSNIDKTEQGKAPLATQEEFSLSDEIEREVEDGVIKTEIDAIRILRQLSSCKDFDSFQQLCLKIETNLPTSELSFHPSQGHSKVYANCPDGYKAYGTSGRDNSCLYQSISFLLVGNESYQNRLKLASTVKAVVDFEVHKSKLSEYDKEDLKLYFEEHVKNMENLDVADEEDLICTCLQELIMDTAKIGNDSSRFQVSLLSIVIDRQIEQHFQQELNTNRQDKVSLDVRFDPLKSPFHIFWVNSSGRNRDMNHIVPLMKEKVGYTVNPVLAATSE